MCVFLPVAQFVLIGYERYVEFAVLYRWLNAAFGFCEYK